VVQAALGLERFKPYLVRAEWFALEEIHLKEIRAYAGFVPVDLPVTTAVKHFAEYMVAQQGGPARPQCRDN
jgi:hypothetical protein